MDHWDNAQQTWLYGDSDYDNVNNNGFTGSRNFYYIEFALSYDDVYFTTGSGSYAYNVVSDSGYIRYEADIDVDFIQDDGVYYS